MGNNTRDTCTMVNQGKPDPHSARNRRRNGNTMLEFALTMMPTFALIMIFLDLGVMFFRWSTLQNAVREGCRYAITFQTASNCGSGGTSQCGQDNSVEQVVQQYALGLVKTTDNPQTIFVNYYAPTALNTPIVAGGNVPNNVVVVSVQNVSYNWILPLAGTYGGSGSWNSSPFTFSVYSSDVLGGLPVGSNGVAE